MYLLLPFCHRRRREVPYGSAMPFQQKIADRPIGRNQRQKRLEMIRCFEDAVNKQNRGIRARNNPDFLFSAHVFAMTKVRIMLGITMMTVFRIILRRSRFHWLSVSFSTFGILSTLSTTAADM